MKHIDVKHHFIWKHVAKEMVDLLYIASSKMAADGLTKPLSAINHAKFIEQLRLKVIKINWQSIKSVIVRASVFVNKHIVRAAKALVINEPIVIFHPKDGKSWLVE